MPHPYYTLDLPETADDNEVRTAYLVKIRLYQPETHPVEFQQITDARDAIDNEEKRAKLRLFGQLYHRRPLKEMAPEFKGATRTRVGIDSWLRLIKKGNQQ
jgi:curved DNA-binding protein CbpA